MRRLLPLLMLLAACSETEHTACKSDDDCPANFTCDLLLYKGECIERVEVVPCGEVLCRHPEEVCIDNDHCARVLGSDAGAGIDGGGGGGDGGARPDMDRRPTEDGGGDPPDLSAEDVPEPTVVIEAPLDGSLYVEETPVLLGQVLQLHQSGVVQLVVDDGEPIEIFPDSGGSFSRDLDDLPVGSHQLTVVATQGPHRAEASVTTRIDFFIRARNGQLFAGERPWRFVGLDAPTLLDLAGATLQSGAADKVDETFVKARQLGATVVRTRAYDDRPDSPTAIQIAALEYGEPGLQALDHVVARAGANGIKLVLPLVGRNATYGGVDQYLRWGGYLVPIAEDRRRFYLDGPIREHFKDHVRFLLDRTNSITGVKYKDDPAILAWEVIDGPDEPGVFADATGNAVAEFMTTMTQLVKGNDENHLVITGDMGFDVNPTPYSRHYDAIRDAGLAPLYDGSHGVAWQRNTRAGATDIAVIHVDPQAFGFPNTANQYANLGAAWIRGHATLAAIEGKPLVILVARMASRPMELPARRDAMQAWFDEVLSLDLAGVVAGNFYADGVSLGDDRTAWGFQSGTEPGDPANEYADLIQGLAVELQ